MLPPWHPKHFFNGLLVQMQIPELFHSIFRQIEGISFAVRYWDGTTRTYGDGTPEFEIDFKNEEGCQRILANPALAFGETYVSGGLDIQGSFDRMFAGILNADLSALPLGFREKLKIAWLALRQRNSIQRAGRRYCGAADRHPRLDCGGASSESADNRHGARGECHQR